MNWEGVTVIPASPANQDLLRRVQILVVASSKTGVVLVRIAVALLKNRVATQKTSVAILQTVILFQKIDVAWLQNFILFWMNGVVSIQIDHAFRKNGVVSFRIDLTYALQDSASLQDMRPLDKNRVARISNSATWVPDPRAPAKNKVAVVLDAVPAACGCRSATEAECVE